jgi:hypothetical protein
MKHELEQYRISATFDIKQLNGEKQNLISSIDKCSNERVKDKKQFMQ